MKSLIKTLLVTLTMLSWPLLQAQTGNEHDHAAHNKPAAQDEHVGHSKPAAGKDGHAGHEMHGGGSDPHAGHAMHGAPSVTTGPWSYLDRDNPAPHTNNRWEMIPVPGYGHMFLHADKVSEDLRCAALQNPGVMVDRATRARCAGTPAPAAQPYAPPARDTAPAHVH